MRRLGWVPLLVVVLTIAVTGSPAHAAFPYQPGSDPSDYGQYRLDASDARPGELTSGAKQTWMYAADQEAGNEPVNSDPRELNGVRGAHMVDATTPHNDLAWATTTGRPDVTISVLDSGIKWNDRGAMLDLRRKTRLNRGEVPVPATSRSTSLEGGEDCSTYASQYDANADGVVNVVDYSCDPRVERDPAQRGGLGVGPSDLLDPQDILIAFSDGDDDDSNGFVDDIVGWDFLDNDNDPFDDVQYGHGTGEARDSSGEADNGGDIGACPNCMVIHMRVGDSFIADSNRFAQATVYAADNGVDVVQEALGTLNNSSLARAAVEYAYDHGVTVIASAADEAAQHHNWPSTLPHVIIVNSVTQYDLAITPATHSYLQFNGCTNFSSKIAIAIPSVSCSSDATGRGSGMAGLIYSAALNAREQGALDHHPDCRRTDGSACLITPNEVRQVMASGRIDGVAQADDVNFAQQPEPSCEQARVPTCTDPNLNAPYDSAVPSPIATTKRYPTRRGHDQVFGYGRVNMNHAVDALVRTGDAALPPEVEITAPDWYEQVDPSRASFALRAQLFARGAGYSCQVFMAPGSQPNNDLDTASPPGDFKRVPSAWCNGDVHTSAFDGVLADVDVQQLKALFPASAGNFDGREPGTGAQTSNGRPNTEPYGFTVKVVAQREQGGVDLQGEDRRNMYLHRDQDMLPGFPGDLGGDGESSPILVDLDGDNRNELVLGSSDGFVHAYRPDGSELPGWPVRGDAPALHTGGRAFQSGDISDDLGGAILGSVAAADVDRDGAPEVVGADMEGKVYAWDDRGNRLWKRESNIDYSGKPLQPFEDVRYVRTNSDESKRRRTQHGFVGSPVLVDLDSNDGGRLEIVAAAMDRHVYAWNDDGSPVPGFPVLVVDPTKVASVDSQTHAVTFNANAGEALNQGAIIDTPAVGDLTGDGHPEIVVGTNEEYATNQGNEGPLNSATFDAQTVALLALVGGIPFPENPADGLAKTNGRVFAIHPEGEDHAGGPFLAGWPVKVAQLQPEVLPLVGEGVAGAPAIGPVECPNGGVGPKVGTGADAGPAYILNVSGQSCYGQENGKDITLQTDFAASPQRYDTPAIPAFGHPIFAGLGPTVSFFMPATGLVRALDIAVNEYQGGQDFMAGWEAHTGQFRPGWPAPVNDLQFLTGPSAANVDSAPGEEVLGGTASLDLAAFNPAGLAAGPGWPKLTSDWMVANPLVGSFGSIDTDSDARNRIVALTRSGSVLAYRTDAPPCPLGSWPRYHHDNANSGDYRRDAVSPGKPTGVSLSGTTVNFTAPGDDLLCGTADHYEIVTSNDPIDGDNFDQADSLADVPQPEAAGSEQSYVLPSGTQAFVAIRAVDDQGNVGRPAVLTTGGYPRPAGATPLRVPLVPAYRECTSPDAQHGPPLAHPSCNPPAQQSGTLTVGTPDANGFFTSSVAFVRFTVRLGDPSSPPDEADVGFELSAADVRCAATSTACPGGLGSDYAGRVLVTTTLRITDRDNDVGSGGGSDPGTVTDVPLEIPAGCTPTAGTQSGATCALTTTIDAVLPGAVKEGDRSIWQTGPIELRDAGPNGSGYGPGCPSSCGDGDEQLFMRQGVFIP